MSRIQFWHLDFSWPPIPETFTPQFGSVTTRGGFGLFGRGAVAFTTIFPPVLNAPVPTAKVLQGGTVGTPYSEVISAQGGTAPYTFAVSVGSLPNGLSLNGATGVISGTPTAVQTSDFTIQATDANAAVGSTDFEIGVTTPASGGGAAAYGWVA